MKRLFSFLVLLCLTCAAHAYDAHIGDFYYNLNESQKTASVCDASRKPVDLVIPETITHQGAEYKVTAVEDKAFWNCPELISITFPKSLKSIGEKAFYVCTNLRRIIHLGTETPQISAEAWRDGQTFYCYVPEKYVDDYYSCYKTWLKKYHIRDNSKLKKSNNGFEYYILDSEDHKVSFSYPVTLKKLPSDFLVPYTTTLDDEDYYVTEIDDYAFYDKYGIESVTIPNTVTSIGANAFVYSELKSVSIPSSVSHIGESAFYGCRSLTSVMLPKSLTEISDYLFQQCTNLESVLIPSSVTSIGGGAFNNCSKLTDINIPNSVTSIKAGAFSYCI